VLKLLSKSVGLAELVDKVEMRQSKVALLRAKRTSMVSRVKCERSEQAES